MALTRLGLNQAINLASNVTGTLATGNGGTGATSFSLVRFYKFYQILLLLIAVQVQAPFQHLVFHKQLHLLQQIVKF